MPAILAAERPASLAPDRPHSLPYFPALDGIRGVAIVGVVGTHFGVPLFAYGGNGVDLFFVLSGYLITLVLLEAPAQPLSVFYWNRFTRLAPALVVLCAVYAGVGLALGLPQTDVAASLTYVANWTRAYDLGVPRYLPHVWSLSLEEQFYIVYPPILLLLDRWLSRRRVAAVLLALCVLVVVWRPVLGASGAAPDRLYNGLDTHADGLALGCALGAFLSAPRVGRAARMMAIVARGDVVAALAVPILFASIAWPSAVLLVDVAAAWLIIGALHPRASTVRPVLAATPLVLLGRLSYSLYLWHFPVLQFLSYEALLRWSATLAVGLPLSLGLAAASYYLIESPILRWRRTIAQALQRRLGALSVAVAIAGMLVGSAYFLGPLVVRSVAPPAFAVEDYGPHESIAGHGFNVQPGGLSVVQVRTTTKPPSSLTAIWNGRELATFPSARGVAIFVPRDFVDMVGRKTIDIEVGDQTIPIIVDVVAAK